MIAPLKNRWHAIINIEPDLAGWKAWAFSHGIAPEVIAFVSANPDYLCPEHKVTRDIDPLASARSWSFLSDWITAGVAITPAMAAAVVGEGAGLAFAAWLDIYKTAIPAFSEVMKSPATAPIPEDPCACFALCSKLAYEANKGNFNKIAVYAARLRGDWQSMLITDCTARHPELKESQAYINWACATADRLAR
jgi:hypothetical protein